MKNKPNFFIVGAPKCGTTALSEYLRSHPNIFLTRPKEPHFFAEDFYRPIKTLEDYYALFDEVRSEHLAIGEASISYLASRVALNKIKNFTPDAKLIVMVRNPIDMIPSLHSQLLATLYEDEENFAEAWSLLERRRNGKNIPKTCRSPIFLDYAYMGSLGSQLERLFEIFHRNHVKVIVFDDFIASPQDEYEAILSFLAVPSDGKREFPKLNPNRVVRSKLITRFAQRPPKLLINTYLKMKKALNIGEIGFFAKVNELNSRKEEREKISQEMRSELVETFREEIHLLSELLERDLTHWLEV